MLNQKERFTNAMRHANNSNNPLGGSTAIQGQPGTARNSKAVQFVQANMMRPATDPDDSHASSTANNGHASSSAAAASPPTWDHGPLHPQVAPNTVWTTFTWGDGSDHIERPEPEPECWGNARTSSSDESPTFYDDAYVHGRRVTFTSPTPTITVPTAVPSVSPEPNLTMLSHEESLEKLRQPTGLKDFNAYYLARVKHDDATHANIQSLMDQRQTIEDALLAIIQEGSPDGTQLGPHPHCAPEYLSLMAQVQAGP
jgi:hypothetical protein